jgi:DNA polymerase/3'-5' exonuclease PolX
MKNMIPIKEAVYHAVRISNLLKPFCEKVHIAGSIRRNDYNPNTFVGDIEIVCLPKTINMPDLFGNTETSVIPDFLKTVWELGTPVKGTGAGRYMQILLPENISLDLFMPQGHDYYRQLAIRTGPADYSHKVIAEGWVKLGWVGTKDGLRRREECIQKDDAKTWVCVLKQPVLPPQWQSEKEFFEWLEVEYKEPYER